MADRETTIQSILLVGIALWAGYSCYAKGKAEGALESTKKQVEAQQKQIDSTRIEITRLTVEGRRLANEVANAKARVITVDKVQMVNIDSALGVLRRTADSGTRALVDEVVRGFEIRLAARDTVIARQDQQIRSDSLTIVGYEKLTAMQANLSSMKDEMIAEMRKIGRNSLGSDLVKVGAVLGAVLIGNAIIK